MLDIKDATPEELIEEFCSRKDLQAVILFRNAISVPSHAAIVSNETFEELKESGQDYFVVHVVGMSPEHTLNALMQTTENLVGFLEK